MGFVASHFSLSHHFLELLIELVQLVCRHWIKRIPSGLGPFLKVDGVIESPSRPQHLSFFLFKKLLILPIRLWHCLQLYSPFFFLFYLSHILCFHIVSHSFIPCKLIRHCFIFYMSVTPCFFNGPLPWVSYIFEGVFIMPPPKGYD